MLIKIDFTSEHSLRKLSYLSHFSYILCSYVKSNNKEDNELVKRKEGNEVRKNRELENEEENQPKGKE